MGKARVTPVKHHYYSRVNSTAVSVSKLIRAGYNITSELFWTDSQIFLGYIANYAKTFHVFIANCSEQIGSETSKKQWR